MRYMLVNSSPGSLQVNLYDPETSYKHRNLHRPGPAVALNLRKGQAIDILKHFDGSVEKAHRSVMHSRDSLKMFRPGILYTYVCDDSGRPINIELLLTNNKVEYIDHPTKPESTPTPDPDATSPDIDLSATLAAQDQFEAEKNGEANPPPSEEKGVVGKVVDLFTGKMKDEGTIEGAEKGGGEEATADEKAEGVTEHTKKLLEAYTKSELVKLAEKDFNLKLKPRMKHDNMIKEVLKAQKKAQK